MRHRWMDDQVIPPVDLRLVPPALAVWAGALTAWLAPGTAWWAAGVAAVALAATVRLDRRWRYGAVASLACLSAALVLTTFRVAERDSDPLRTSAENGSWALLVVTIARFPESLQPAFPLSDQSEAPQGDQSAAGAHTRWRFGATVETAIVAGVTWTSHTTITIEGVGADWSALIPGQRVSVVGRLRMVPLGGLPVIMIRARDPPDLIDGAPRWFVVAGAIRTDLMSNAAALREDEGGLLRGLVVGDTGGINDRLDADAKTTGLSHLLAVSGSHFAILCGIVVVVLRRAGPRLAALGGVATMVALVILVGPQPSVLRAALMGGIGMLALLSGRRRTAVPALATAVIGLLLTQPELALSVGFALSVVATGGLVLLAPPWSEALQRRGVPRGWADVLTVPVAAQIVTMPIIVLISDSISAVGVLANLVVAPVMAPALVLGVLCALTGPWFPWAAGAFAQLTAPLLRWVAGTAHHLAAWPNATVPWPGTPTGALTLALLSMSVLMLLRHSRIRTVMAAAAAGALVVFIPTRFVSPGWPATGWLVTACEVGQGDAIVLSTGQPGAAVVVDTGPDPGPMNACLDRLGVDTIPLLVLTHLHADHIDGLEGVLQGRTVGTIAVGPGREPTQAWARVQQEAGALGIPMVQFSPGEQWSAGELHLAVLAPAREFRGTDSDPNNDSVVMMAALGGKRMLLTGDIEIEAQQALLNSDADLAADVLKVPHHGSSKLLAEFVTAVSPAVAVISVGVGNNYGHPSDRALTMLDRAGVAAVLRTDSQGDVSVGVTDGELSTANRGASGPPD